MLCYRCDDEPYSEALGSHTLGFGIRYCRALYDIILLCALYMVQNKSVRFRKKI